MTRTSLAADPDRTARTRHKQAALFVHFTRLLRDLTRGLAWAKLSAADRRRLRKALETLEGEVLLAGILTRGPQEPPEGRRPGHAAGRGADRRRPGEAGPGGGEEEDEENEGEDGGEQQEEDGDREDGEGDAV